VAVDSAGNVFVADSANAALMKIPFSQGHYGVPVIIASGFSNNMYGVAVDVAGDVFVADTFANVILELPFISQGSYGAAVSIGSGFNEESDSVLDPLISRFQRLQSFYNRAAHTGHYVLVIY
jgi:hypothetical protein